MGGLRGASEGFVGARGGLRGDKKGLRGAKERAESYGGCSGYCNVVGRWLSKLGRVKENMDSREGQEGAR